MSSEAQNVIADVIGKHRPIDSRDGEDGLCSCGWQEGVRWGPPTCAEHLAEEIDKALGGLTREEQWVRSAGEVDAMPESQGRHRLGFPRTSVEFIAWLVTLDGRCEMCGFVFGHDIDCPWRKKDGSR